MDDSLCRLGRYGVCDKEKCAIWDKKDQCCAVLTIASVLKKTTEILDRIESDLHAGLIKGT